MTGWPKHALALAALAAISLGLYGRLYSPLDHAYPDGEAASAAVTRFVAENPNLWGWNPTWAGGEPTQVRLRPTFHYAAALVTKLGNEPIYAHRIVAVTLVLFSPLALYLMVISFGGSGLMALGSATGVIFLSPLAIHQKPLLTFLPTQLMYLEHLGIGPDLAGITLIWIAMALLWRAAHDRRPLSLFLAAISIALVALSSGIATSFLTIVLVLLELAMLGIAGEYRFSHRRVFAAIIWALSLSIFAFADVKAYYGLAPSFYGLAWEFALAGALSIRLLFLGRRQPFLCLVTMGVWVFFAFQMWLMLEVFLILAIFAWMWKAFEQPQKLYRLAAVFPALLLFWHYEPIQQRFYPVTVERLKAQFREWRGDWGMRRPSESEDFRISRWFVENPPRGRIYIDRFHSLVSRMNAWVPYAQAGQPGQLNPTVLHGRRNGNEYLVASKPLDQQLPVAFKSGKSVVYRLPFQSLAMSAKNKNEGRPLELTWISNNHVRIAGTLPREHSIDVEIYHHPGWSSSVPVGEDENGLIRLTPPAGPVDLHLEFKGTQSQHILGYLSAFAWVASLGYVAFRSRRA